jgi:hypothetical protein
LQAVFWVTAGFLGWFNRPVTMGLAAAAVLGTVLIVRARSSAKHHGSETATDGQGEHAGGDADGPAVPAWVRRTAFALLVIVLVGSAAGLLFRSFSNYPFLADDYGYHLVSPLWWVQSGELTAHAFDITPEMNGYYSPINGYPRSFEVVASFLTLWSGSYASTCLTWLFFFVPGVLLTWELLRRWRVGREFRMLAVLLLCSQPIVQLHAGSLYTDVATAALFPCSLFFLLRWLHDGELIDAALFGLCIGLVAGFKVSGAVHAFTMLVVAVVLQMVWKKRRFQTLRSQIVILGSFALLSGGAWYVFNLVVHGNPVYPITVEWNGLVPSLKGSLSALIFTEERLQQPWATLIESLRNPGWFWTAGGATHGLGPWFAAFGLPAFIACPLLVKKFRAEVIVFVAVVAFAFLTQPARWYPRFILFAVWCSAILICAVGSRIHHVLRPILATGLVLCILGCLLVGWPQTLLPVAVAMDYDDLESWCLGSHPWNLTAHRLLWENSSAWRGRTILVPSRPEVLTRCQSPDLAYRLVAYDFGDPQDLDQKLDRSQADLLFVVAPGTRLTESGRDVWNSAWSRESDLRLLKYDEIPKEWAYRPSLVFWNALFEVERSEGARP